MVNARIPELKDCGCGIPLVVGAKIISAVFFIISCLVFLISVVYIVKSELEENNLQDPDLPLRRQDTYIEVIAAMGMIVSGVQGTLAALLWYGVTTHEPSFVLPWAILTTAFTLIFTFIDFLLLLQMPAWTPVILFVILVVLYYCVLIVYSHFRELRREKNLPQTLSENDAS